MAPGSNRFSLLSVAVAVGWLFAGPAAADWLVTIDGETVETRGSWQVQGKLVVFHGADGTLSSIRLTEVDLAASEARTEAAAKQAAAKARARPAVPAERPKARFVVTDADVAHVEEPPLRMPADSAAGIEGGEGAGPESSPSAAGEAVAPEDNPLEVVSWDAVLGAEASGVSITGVIKNPSEFFASGIAIRVRVLDLNGEEIASESAKPKAAALAPGEQSSFQISLPDVFIVGNALFEITSFNAVASKRPDES